MNGDSVSFTATTWETDGGDCAPPTWSTRWTSKDSQLTWTDVNVVDFAHVFGGKPWQRIG